MKNRNFSKDLNKLHEDNKTVTYDGMQMTLILKELDFILVSLHKIGSYYAEDITSDREQYQKETTQFIDNSFVCSRLANIRSSLTRKFNREEGDDGLDDIERICEQIPYWKKPGDYCNEFWIKSNYGCE